MTPVTLLTGFLGAGKTTLLRHVLAEIGGDRTVVIENEFGAANLDSELLETVAPGMVRMVNGCICCAVVGDLWHTFQSLLEARAAGTIAFDRVIVETTGMAEPAGLIEVFYRGDTVQDAFFVNSVVTVVDAVNGARDLRNSPTAQGQAALADVLVVNKTDLADPAALLADLRGVNPLAEVLQTAHGRVAWAALSARRFDKARLPAHAGHVHEAMTSVLVEADGPHDPNAVMAWLRSLVDARPYDFYRVKGVVHGPERIFVQAVHDLLTRELMPDWGDRPRRTRLVFIGVDLDHDALAAGLAEARRDTG